MRVSVISRMSPVEHIYIAFPTFLFLNSSIGGALLEPLLESQATLTGQQFAAQDLGDDTYPIASGPSAVAQAGVERECQTYSSSAIDH